MHQDSGSWQCWAEAEQHLCIQIISIHVTMQTSSELFPGKFGAANVVTYYLHYASHREVTNCDSYAMVAVYLTPCIRLVPTVTGAIKRASSSHTMIDSMLVQHTSHVVDDSNQHIVYTNLAAYCGLLEQKPPSRQQSSWCCIQDAHLASVSNQLAESPQWWCSAPCSASASGSCFSM